MDDRVPRRGDPALPPEAVLRDVVALTALVLGIGTAVALQGPAGEATALRQRNDFRWTPDPAFVGVLAGAHRSTTADLLWLRTLPDLSREFADPVAKARWIDHSLDAITDLEPSFMTVYDFGQSYLAILDRSAKGSVDRAIKLLEKGIDRNPQVSGLYVRLAMLQYMEKRDTDRAVELLRRASTLDGFDTLSASMLSALQARKHDDVVAVGYWLERMENGTPEIRRVAELGLWRIKAEIARRAARDFRKETGRVPARPEDIATPDLVAPEVVGVIREGLEIDAQGVPRYPHAAELELAETIRVAEAWARRFRDDAGRWPTLQEFGALPAAPGGKRFRVEEGRVILEDAPR